MNGEKELTRARFDEEVENNGTVWGAACNLVFEGFPVDAILGLFSDGPSNIVEQVKAGFHLHREIAKTDENLPKELSEVYVRLVSASMERMRDADVSEKMRQTIAEMSVRQSFETEIEKAVESLLSRLPRTME